MDPKQTLKLLLALIIFDSLFYYIANYFLYYLWVPLYFLILFIGHTILLQLIFTFIYSIFNKKFSISVKLSIVLLSCRESQHSMLNSSLRGLMLSKHENPFILHKKKMLSLKSQCNFLLFYFGL